MTTATKTEYHTSFLTASCNRQAYLTREGKAVGEATGALFRGIAASAAMEYAHAQKLDPACAAGAAITGWSEAEAQCEAENRPLSEAVGKNKPKTLAEIERVVSLYCDRFRQMFSTAKRYYTEVPIRWAIDVDGEPAEFASHLDLLWQAAGGSWYVDDWKWRADAPSPHYLSRNMQLGMYALAVAHGEVLLDDFWVALDAMPVVTWVHLPHLLPYTMKVKAKDDSGQLVTFAKGDPRPLKNIRCTADIHDEAVILDEFRQRVRMDRAGFHPTSPDPIGCRLCECSRHCPSFDGDGKGEQQ